MVLTGVTSLQLSLTTCGTCVELSFCLRTGAEARATVVSLEYFTGRTSKQPLSTVADDALEDLQASLNDRLAQLPVAEQGDTQRYSLALLVATGEEGSVAGQQLLYYECAEALLYLEQPELVCVCQARPAMAVARQLVAAGAAFPTFPCPRVQPAASPLAKSVACSLLRAVESGCQGKRGLFQWCRNRDAFEALPRPATSLGQGRAERQGCLGARLTSWWVTPPPPPHQH